MAGRNVLGIPIPSFGSKQAPPVPVGPPDAADLDGRNSIVNACIYRHGSRSSTLTSLEDTFRALHETPDGVAWIARAIASRDDTTSVLRDLDRPVVLLLGAEDEATPPQRGEEMLALRGDLPTRLVVLPATGHLTALESPQEVADVIDDLLRERP